MVGILGVVFAVLAAAFPPYIHTDYEPDGTVTVHGIGYHCFGDLRWAADYPFGEEYERKHRRIYGYDPPGGEYVFCPPLYLEGRYRIEIPTQHDEEVWFGLQPWREPEHARARGWCGRWNNDDSRLRIAGTLDTAAGAPHWLYGYPTDEPCSGPQFLTVGYSCPDEDGTICADIPVWTIRFIPEEDQ